MLSCKRGKRQEQRHIAKEMNRCARLQCCKTHLLNLTDNMTVVVKVSRKQDAISNCFISAPSVLDTITPSLAEL